MGIRRSTEFFSKYASVVFVAVLVSSCVLPARAQIRKDTKDMAERLLRDMYPQYGESQVVVIEDRKLKETPEGVRFTVELRQCGKSEMWQHPCSRLELSTDFSYRAFEDVPDVYFLRFPTQDPRATTLQRIARKEHTWSKQRLAAELRKAGAKYGPDREQEFLAALPMKALEGVFGEVSIQSVEYVTNQLSSPYWPGVWVINLVSHQAGKRDRWFTLGFEPFEGMLMSFNGSLTG